MEKYKIIDDTQTYIERRRRSGCTYSWIYIEEDDFIFKDRTFKCIGGPWPAVMPSVVSIKKAFKAKEVFNG